MLAGAALSSSGNLIVADVFSATSDFLPFLQAAAKASQPQQAPDLEPQPTPADQQNGSSPSSDEDQLTEDEEREGCVALVTGDFAMQNVCLQMGLKLSAPEGTRVTRVARWALRCAACFKVTLVSRSCWHAQRSPDPGAVSV